MDVTIPDDVAEAMLRSLLGQSFSPHTNKCDQKIAERGFRLERTLANQNKFSEHVLILACVVFFLAFMKCFFFNCGYRKVKKTAS